MRWIPPKAPLLYGSSLLLGLFITLGMYVDLSQPSAWDAVALEGQTELVFAFSPAHCELLGPDIRELNQFAEESPLPIRTIMLRPPDDEKERVRLAGRFPFTVPISFDTKGRWERAIRSAGMPPSGAAVRLERGRPIAVAKPLDWRRVFR